MSIKNKILYRLYLLTKTHDYRSCEWLRIRIVQGLLGKQTRNLLFRSNVNLHGVENLDLGNDVSINHGCFISAQGGLKIGDFVAIGHNTSILTTEHTFADLAKPIKYQPVENRPVSIGNNVWIGANATILGGVSIADNTIVAAGAVVSRSIEQEFTIVGGVPAKFIKSFAQSAASDLAETT